MPITEQFGITRENFPQATAFIEFNKLLEYWNDGYHMYGYFLSGEMVGYVSLDDLGDGNFEMCHLSVLPQYRQAGYGLALVDFCKVTARNLGGKKLKLSFISENERLKAWYLQQSFVFTGVKDYGLVFTPGYMEYNL